MLIGEEKPLLVTDVPVAAPAGEGLHVYKRRWWITVVMALACVSQAMVWDTWGPIAESAELVLGWTDGTIAQITNMSSISYVILVLPFSMLIDARGLRLSMLLCSALLLIATGIRVFTLAPDVFTPLAYVGALLQGVAGIISFSGPAMFAAVWFPLQQRANITAVISLCNNLGMIVMFIIGPQLVPNPVRESTVHYIPTNSSSNADDPVPITTDYTRDEHLKVNNFEDMKTGIQNVLYIHTALSALVFVFVLIYFPDKPPKPPSLTASLSKTIYGEAIKSTISNAQLWIIVVAGSLPRAVAGAWISVFDVVVKHLGVSQIDAGWIGFWHTLLGCVASLLFAKFPDFLNNRRKGLLVGTTVVGVAIGVWIALLCDGTIELDLVSLYVSCILFGIVVNGTLPLFYEISAETAYPVGEGVAGGFFTLVFAFFEFVFFSTLSIPGVGVTWMTWACCGSLCLSLPLIVLFQERNKRFEIDVTVKPK